MDDKLFWLQLTLWMMLPLDHVFEAWHRRAQTPKLMSSFGIIVGAGFLLSVYALYSFYNPVPRWSADPFYEVVSINCDRAPPGPPR
jgi:hypothetical protein